MRIISLLPSATEILCDLGLEADLVGISHSCDYPASISGLPRVTRTSIPRDAPSAEIDRAVRELQHAGRPLYELDQPLLAALAPDLLVTQGLCSVCAVSDEAALALLPSLPGSPRVLSLAPATFGDVLRNVLDIGAATGRMGQAQEVVQVMRQRIGAIVRVTAGVPRRPRVTLLEWADPPFACGHWVPELVDLAGGRESHGRSREPSRTMSWEEVVQSEPEILVMCGCGLEVRRARLELDALATRPGFERLPCVRTRRVYLLDGVAGFSRPGPRLVNSVETLAHLLHPQRVKLPVHPLHWEPYFQ